MTNGNETRAQSSKIEQKLRTLDMGTAQIQAKQEATKWEKKTIRGVLNSWHSTIK